MADTTWREVYCDQMGKKVIFLEIPVKVHLLEAVLSQLYITLHEWDVTVVQSPVVCVRDVPVLE